MLFSSVCIGANLAKAVELVVTIGTDLSTGKTVGQTGIIDYYDSFVEAVKKQIAYMTGRVMDYIRKIERHYKDITSVGTLIL